MGRDLYEIIEALPEPQYEEAVPEIAKHKPRGKPWTTRSQSDHMRALHADPRFSAEHRERGRRLFMRLNRDPRFNEVRLERLRATMEDPDFRERCRQAALKRWAKRRGEL